MVNFSAVANVHRATLYLYTLTCILPYGYLRFFWYCAGETQDLLDILLGDSSNFQE